MMYINLLIKAFLLQNLLPTCFLKPTNVTSNITHNNEQLKMSSQERRLTSALGSLATNAARRQEIPQHVKDNGNMPPARAFRAPTPTMNLNEIPAPLGGPPRSVRYDPGRGYEMYWANGHWVFATSQNNYPANMCGRSCLPMYKEYGEVCARNKFFIYDTFADYCEMKSEDCYGLYDWTVVHTGKCLPVSENREEALGMGDLPLSMQEFTKLWNQDY